MPSLESNPGKRRHQASQGEEIGSCHSPQSVQEGREDGVAMQGRSRHHPPIKFVQSYMHSLVYANPKGSSPAPQPAKSDPSCRQLRKKLHTCCPFHSSPPNHCSPCEEVPVTCLLCLSLTPHSAGSPRSWSRCFLRLSSSGHCTAFLGPPDTQQARQTEKSQRFRGVHHKTDKIFHPKVKTSPLTSFWYLSVPLFSCSLTCCSRWFLLNSCSVATYCM